MFLEVVKVERYFGTPYVLEFQEHLFFGLPFTFHLSKSFESNCEGHIFFSKAIGF